MWTAPPRRSRTELEEHEREGCQAVPSGLKSRERNDPASRDRRPLACRVCRNAEFPDCAPEASASRRLSNRGGMGTNAITCARSSSSLTTNFLCPPPPSTKSTTFLESFDSKHFDSERGFEPRAQTRSYPGVPDEARGLRLEFVATITLFILTNTFALDFCTSLQQLQFQTRCTI